MEERKQLLSSGKVEIVRKRFRLNAALALLSLKRGSKSFGHHFDATEQYSSIPRMPAITVS